MAQKLSVDFGFKYDDSLEVLKKKLKEVDRTIKSMGKTIGKASFDPAVFEAEKSHAESLKKQIALREVELAQVQSRESEILEISKKQTAELVKQASIRAGGKGDESIPSALTDRLAANLARKESLVLNPTNKSVDEFAKITKENEAIEAKIEKIAALQAQEAKLAATEESLAKQAESRLRSPGLATASTHEKFSEASVDLELKTKEKLIQLQRQFNALIDSGKASPRELAHAEAKITQAQREYALQVRILDVRKAIDTAKGSVASASAAGDIQGLIAAFGQLQDASKQVQGLNLGEKLGDSFAKELDSMKASVAETVVSLGSLDDLKSRLAEFPEEVQRAISGAAEAARPKNNPVLDNFDEAAATATIQHKEAQARIQAEINALTKSGVKTDSDAIIALQKQADLLNIQFDEWTRIAAIRRKGVSALSEDKSVLSSISQTPEAIAQGLNKQVSKNLELKGIYKDANGKLTEGKSVIEKTTNVVKEQHDQFKGLTGTLTELNQGMTLFKNTWGKLITNAKEFRQTNQDTIRQTAAIINLREGGLFNEDPNAARQQAADIVRNVRSEISKGNSLASFEEVGQVLSLVSAHIRGDAEQVADMSLLIANAVKIAAPGPNQALSETRALLNGDENRNASLARLVHLSDEEKAAIKLGKAYEVLAPKLRLLVATNSAFEDNLTTSLIRLSSSFNEFIDKISSAGAEKAVGIINDISDSINSIDQSTIENISSAILSIVEALGQIVKFVAQHPDLVATAIGAGSAAVAAAGTAGIIVSTVNNFKLIATQAGLAYDAVQKYLVGIKAAKTATDVASSASAASDLASAAASLLASKKSEALLKAQRITFASTVVSMGDGLKTIAATVGGLISKLAIFSGPLLSVIGAAALIYKAFKVTENQVLGNELSAADVSKLKDEIGKLSNKSESSDIAAAADESFAQVSTAVNRHKKTQALINSNFLDRTGPEDAIKFFADDNEAFERYGEAVTNSKLVLDKLKNKLNQLSEAMSSGAKTISVIDDEGNERTEIITPAKLKEMYDDTAARILQGNRQVRDFEVEAARRSYDKRLTAAKASGKTTASDLLKLRNDFDGKMLKIIDLYPTDSAGLTAQAIKQTEIKLQDKATRDLENAMAQIKAGRESSEEIIKRANAAANAQANSNLLIDAVANLQVIKPDDSNSAASKKLFNYYKSIASDIESQVKNREKIDLLKSQVDSILNEAEQKQETNDQAVNELKSIGITSPTKDQLSVEIKKVEARRRQYILNQNKDYVEAAAEFKRLATKTNEEAIKNASDALKASNELAIAQLGLMDSQAKQAATFLDNNQKIDGIRKQTRAVAKKIIEVSKQDRPTNDPLVKALDERFTALKKELHDTLLNAAEDANRLKQSTAASLEKVIDIVGSPDVTNKFAAALDKAASARDLALEKIRVSQNPTELAAANNDLLNATLDTAAAMKALSDQSFETLKSFGANTSKLNGDTTLTDTLSSISLEKAFGELGAFQLDQETKRKAAEDQGQTFTPSFAESLQGLTLKDQVAGAAIPVIESLKASIKEGLNFASPFVEQTSMSQGGLFATKFGGDTSSILGIMNKQQQTLDNIYNRLLGSTVLDQV